MVDEFSSEQEQVEAIQKWIKTHGPSIIIGIAVGLAAIFGWRYWNVYQDRQAEKASDYYSSLTEALGNDDLAKASGQAEVLQQDYAGSAYAVLAKFALAKAAVEDSDNAAAEQHLRWILNESEQVTFAPVARLRLIRVLLAEGKLDDARSVLNQVTQAEYDAEKEELSGDLYVAAEQPELARSAYQRAQTAAGVSGARGSMLQLKLDALPAAPESK